MNQLEEPNKRLEDCESEGGSTGRRSRGGGAVEELREGSDLRRRGAMESSMMGGAGEGGEGSRKGRGGRDKLSLAGSEEPRHGAADQLIEQNGGIEQVPGGWLVLTERKQLTRHERKRKGLVRSRGGSTSSMYGIVGVWRPNGNSGHVPL